MADEELNDTTPLPEYHHPLDDLLGGPDPKSEPTQPPQTAETQPAVETVPQPEQPPEPAAETPPAAAAPPEPEPPPAAAAPEPAPAPSAQPEPVDRAYKRARQAEQQAREAQQELVRERERAAMLEQQAAELRRQAEQREREAAGEVTPPDPVTELQQRQQMTEQQLEAIRLENRLQQEANVFSQTHPDYTQALEYYIQNQREEAEATGELDMVADNVRRMAANEVRTRAMQTGMTEADAARELAAGVIFQQRRQMLMVGAQRRGMTVPALIYELSGKRGFAGRTAAPEPAPTAPPEASAVERVRQEQAAAAQASLAGLATTGTAPPKSIRSREELRAFLATLSPQEQERYITQQDVKNPRWLENLL